MRADQINTKAIWILGLSLMKVFSQPYQLTEVKPFVGNKTSTTESKTMPPKLTKYRLERNLTSQIKCHSEVKKE